MYPVSETCGPWVCHISVFVAYLYAAAVGMHTFLVALVRYIYIVFSDYIGDSGKQRVVNYACKAGIATSFLMAATATFVRLHRRSRPVMFVEQCYGRKLETNIDTTFCNMDVMSLNATYGDWSNVMQDFVFGGCVSTVATNIIFHSNIPEALMYCHIYWRLKRLVKKFISYCNISALQLRYVCVCVCKYGFLYLGQEIIMLRDIYRMIQEKDGQEEVKSRLMYVSLAISWNVLATFWL